MNIIVMEGCTQFCQFPNSLFHLWVALSLFRFSVDKISKKSSFVGRLKESKFSVGNFETKRFSVGKIKTNTSFCG